ncbi:MAG: hypothetical protein JNM07_03905 [Phycisphaerae bacterium]|nr:hypothetical protein [Phycisphaerae bacterium]
MSIAILACEMVGSRREETGRRLAWVVAALSALPPAWALIQLAFFAITHARGVPTVP